MILIKNLLYSRKQPGLFTNSLRVSGIRPFAAVANAASFDKKNINKLRKLADSWTPLSPLPGAKRSVAAKFALANHYMTRLCNFIDSPTEQRTNQLLKTLNSTTEALKMERGGSSNGISLLNSQPPVALQLGKHQQMSRLTMQLFTTFMELALRNPRSDFSKEFSKIINWSSRNQQNIKVGMRLLKKLQRGDHI